MKKRDERVIALSKEQRAQINRRIRDYFQTELDLSIGEIAAEQLLRALASEIGALFYNRGLEDAQVQLRRKLEELDEDLYGLTREPPKIED
jgi:uncharacterized protein (DUF2164 family)